MKIMIVEDEADIREALSTYFIKNGYQVEEAENGHEAWLMINNSKPDLIIMDIMMPRMDGLELCMKIKNKDIYSDIPVIMLTAKKEEIDVVLGLECGADDYIKKPFSLREVLARVKAITRRNIKEGDESLRFVRHKKLAMNSVNRQVYWNEERVYLTNKEFEILYILATHPGEIFSRDEILDRVWSKDYSGNMHVVDLHIKNLRKKLKMVTGDLPKGLIVSLWKKGYKFEYEE